MRVAREVRWARSSPSCGHNELPRVPIRRPHAAAWAGKPAGFGGFRAPEILGAPNLILSEKLRGRLDILATGIPASGPGAGCYRTDFLYDVLALQTVLLKWRLFSYSRCRISYSRRQLVIRGGELVIRGAELVIRANN